MQAHTDSGAASPKAALLFWCAEALLQRPPTLLFQRLPSPAGDRRGQRQGGRQAIETLSPSERRRLSLALLHCVEVVDQSLRFTCPTLVALFTKSIERRTRSGHGFGQTLAFAALDKSIERRGQIVLSRRPGI